MAERYMVTGTGIKDNVPYSILSHILSGVKDNGDMYEFIDNKSSTQRESEQMKLGTIIEYEMKRVTPKQTLNINNKFKED